MLRETRVHALLPVQKTKTEIRPTDNRQSHLTTRHAPPAGEATSVDRSRTDADTQITNSRSTANSIFSRLCIYRTSRAYDYLGRI